MKKLNEIWKEIDLAIDNGIGNNTRLQIGLIGISWFITTGGLFLGIINLWLSHFNIMLKIFGTIIAMPLIAFTVTAVYYAQDRFLGNFCKDMKKWENSIF